MSNLNLRILGDLILGLPPLAEQKRIVAKVDQLMGLIDELEQEQTRTRDTGDRFAKASLEALATAEGPDEFDHAWNRVLKNSELVLDRPEKVGEVKRSVLRAALTGSLGNAEPSTWTEGNVGDFVEFLNGYAFQSEWYSSAGVRLLRNVNVSHGVLDWSSPAYVTHERGREYERFKLSEGDLVVSLDRPIISTGVKVARVRSMDLPCLLLQRVARAAPRADLVCPGFLFAWLMSPLFTDAIDPGRSKGVPHISTGEIERLPFRCPGIKEQKRIVATIDQLMPLLDDLEAKLRKQEKTATRLAESLAAAVAV